MRHRFGACPVPLAALVLAVILPAAARAQDSNYWSLAYGTRSQLLGGVMIGSPGDISSVYYNPGALALAQNVELLISGSAYRYQRLSIDGGSGPGRNLVSSWLAATPSLFAGEIPILDHDRLAYSFLGRHQSNMEMMGRFTAGSEIPPTSPDLSALELDFNQNLSENWFGLTWAHKLSSTLGIGVSPYLGVRSQNTGISAFRSSQDAASTASVFNVSRRFDYLHWRLLARFGLSGVRDSLTYGLVFTTPGLGLFGGGGLRANTTLVDESGQMGHIAGASYQTEIKADYRSPMGVGAGASFGWGATRVHAAVEWNAEVPRYEVMHGDDYIIRTPSGDSTATLIVDQELDAVLNYGVGIERRLSPTLFGYASFHTDYSGRQPTDLANASVSSWDLSHISAGATWHVLRSDLTLGASTAFSSQPVPPSQVTEMIGANADLESHVMMITVLAAWKITF